VKSLSDKFTQLCIFSHKSLHEHFHGIGDWQVLAIQNLQQQRFLFSDLDATLMFTQTFLALSIYDKIKCFGSGSRFGIKSEYETFI